METQALTNKTVTLPIEQPFQIHLNDRNILEIAFIGRQTEATIEATLQAAQPFMDDLRRRGLPINMLADNARMTGSTISANQRVLQAYKELPLHKAAGINANKFVRFALNAIITTSGLSNKVKLFHNRAAAERWLLEP